jgi:monoamine oxidase
MRIFYYLLLIGAMLNSCDKSDDLNINIPPDTKVIVVGAGASGLYAGKILNDNKVDFTILEASDRIGGRLKKNTNFTDFALDLGAEWIHGNKSLTFDWASSDGVEIYEDNSQENIWYKNLFYDENNIPANLLPIFNYINEESTGGDDISLQDWAINQGYGSDEYDLLDALAGDFGASASEFSMKQTAIESENWSSGKNDYKFLDQTYYDLINNAIVTQIESNIVLNSPVTQINYEGDQIIVTAGDTSYEADRVILTVSVSVLKSGIIEFVPALSNSKTNAIHRIGMEAGTKIYLKFNSFFFGNKDVLGTSIGSAYYDAAYGKNSDQSILGVFVMGEKAQVLSDMTESAAVQSIIDELDLLHDGKASASFTGEYIMQDWGKEPYILGAYSYSTVGIGDARSILAQPVDNKLFFAGEASHLNGHYQTVQGALETGEREAVKVLSSF